MKHLKKFNEFGLTEEINEGFKTTVLKVFLKSYMRIASIIKGFKKLFNSVDRNKLFKDLKVGSKIVDILFFLNESKWAFEDNLTDEDLEKLAKKYDIDKDYPNAFDILIAEYKKEFKRDFKKDLDDIYNYLTDEKELEKLYDKAEPKTIAQLNQLTKLIEDLKDMSN